MKRAAWMGAAAAICAAASAALLAGAMPQARPFVVSVISLARADQGGSPIYYQDPDGKPFYSPTPKKTADGRAWRAVPASADISFEEP